MKLSTALSFTDGDVVAFVGGGGKSTAMFRLAREIADNGGRVITTTTTRLGTDQLTLAPAHFSAYEANPATLAAALDKHKHILLTGPVDHGLGKATGLAETTLEKLLLEQDLTALLIEADGSKQLPFKAPAAHEPAIPTFTTLVVPMVGWRTLGAPLDPDHVHRPEVIRELIGLTSAGTVTLDVIARVLLHPHGGLKNVPASARVIPLLNQVETPEQLAEARSFAMRLLQSADIYSVAIGAVKKAIPITELHGRVAAIVLAAGESKRMGQPKQLLPWGGGTMLTEVIQRLQQTNVSEIIVVTGAERVSVETLLQGKDVRFAHNSDYATTEMARSLQIGLRGLAPNVSAVMVALADQPQIEPATVEKILQRWREKRAPVIAPFFGEQRGHPLLFDRAVWDDILKLPATANPRDFLRTVERIEKVLVETDSILKDIDTPDDYNRLGR